MNWLLVGAWTVIVVCAAWIAGVACCLWTSNQVRVSGVKIRVTSGDHPKWDGDEPPLSWAP